MYLYLLQMRYVNVSHEALSVSKFHVLVQNLPKTYGYMGYGYHYII